MSIVSSFCGPQGLIWGYDVAKENSLKQPNLKREKFNDATIKNAANLRKAAKELFGTKQKLHFPLLPGSHVPCAGRFLILEGPVLLYAAIAIGIPQNRDKSACLIMEDVGQLAHLNMKSKIMLNVVLSVLEIGKNQNIKYKEIFVDFVSKKIMADEVGAALVAVPYFRLAKKALTKNLSKQTLQEWSESRKSYFLNSHN